MKSRPVLVEPLTVRVPTAAAMIGVGHSTMFELIRCKKVKSVKIEGLRAVVVESLRELVSEAE